MYWISPALLNCGIIAKTIANAGGGEDETWPLGERFDFLAQLRHVDMQAVRPIVRLRAPEGFEQVVLGGGQADFLFTEQHPPLHEIHHKWPRLVTRRGAGL